jgi:general secretion pathway protein G
LDNLTIQYVYKFPGQHGDVDLYSHGGDGQEGGEADAADIVSLEIAVRLST